MKAIDQVRVGVRVLSAMRSQWWPADRIRDYQERALNRMLRHAVANVPVYQRLGVHPDSITGSADLDRFPVIGKADLQREPDAFLATGLARGELHASRTSGSSGQPTTTYFDHRAWLLSKYALKMRRVAATAGLPLLRRVMIVSETRPGSLGALAQAAPRGFGLYQTRYVSIHTPTDQHLTVLVEYRPHIIYASPSYLLDLVTTAERRGEALPRVAVLQTSSEALTAAARRRIEAAFSGRLYDVYGSTEFKEVAWQCHAGRYHLNFEGVFLEMGEPGSVGPALLSSLCNVAMPLLRFDIGDRVRFTSNDCPCGRASPQMLEFLGREADMINLQSGRRLSPYVLTTVVEEEDSILQYRIVETAPSAFRLDVVVRSPGQSETWSARVCAELRRVIGEPASVTVSEVAMLPPAASGKRSVFVRARADLA